MMRVTGREDSSVAMSGRQVHERLASLRRHTAPYHDTLERTVDIYHRLDSSSRYADLLARLYGFYEPFEAALDLVAARWEMPIDVDARRKAPLIACDLAALGGPHSVVDGPSRCVGLPRPTSPAIALGCLYVTEGATLGGRIIARLVERRLGLGPRDGASFFHGYGDDTGPRWRALCSLIAAASCSTEAEDAILAGAIETFIAYDRWLEGLSQERALPVEREDRAPA
jgi:heme oxygenase (biliverdin-IX-beta and delta-forming)